jgi:hypothetical protein
MGKDIFIILSIELKGFRTIAFSDFRNDKLRIRTLNTETYLSVLYLKQNPERLPRVLFSVSIFMRLPQECPEGPASGSMS